MLSHIITYSKFGNLFCGVEHTSINGQEKLYGLLLKKKKDEFLVEKTFKSTDIDKLIDFLPKNQPLFLIINNEKVLFKSVPGVFDAQKALALAFPNLKKEDFYYEVSTAKSDTYIAICRKEYVDSLIEEYQKESYQIVGFSLGNLAIFQLAGFIEDDEIYSSNSSIYLKNGAVESISYSNGLQSNLYTINGLQVASKYILSLAGILNYYVGHKNSVSNFSTRIDKLNDNFKQQRLFSILLKFGLAFIFVLLLISYLFFSSYTSKIDYLNAALELNKTDKNTLLKLTDAVQKKEQLVKNFSLSSSKASWYLAQVGKLIPASILLSEIKYQPLVKNAKEDEEILLEKYNIVIKGKSSDNVEFSKWVKKLELQDWIDKVVIVEYGADKATTTKFELQIKITQ